MSTNLTITDAAEITALQPYLAREEQKDAVNVAHFEREAARRRGMAGAPLELVRERTQSERVQAARAAWAEHEAWKASPRGRLRAALRGLADVGYASIAQRCITAYERGVSQPNIVHADLSFILHELTTVGGDAGAATKFAREAFAAAGELAFAPHSQEAA